MLLIYFSNKAAIDIFALIVVKIAESVKTTKLILKGHKNTLEHIVRYNIENCFIAHTIYYKKRIPNRGLETIAITNILMIMIITSNMSTSKYTKRLSDLLYIQLLL